jgi:NAD(P)H-dependent flavin oxidoreductase YrpB (nitropropane dioxygenase family)
VIVAQGTEAAGHTPDISTMVLVPEVVDAVSPVPVLAAGGIGTGRQMAAGLALGAQGAWTGSIWLTTSESTLPKAAVEKLLAATSRDTVRSRSLSGKPARQLRTKWTDLWDSPDSPGTLPMPLQFLLTADAVYRIHRSEHPELLGAPVGQIVGRMNEVRPTALVVADLVRECEETLQRLRALG